MSVGKGSCTASLASQEPVGQARRGPLLVEGDVLAGAAEGRRDDDEITSFDSTGLAIQDLAIALTALERAPELDLPRIEL